MIICHPLKLIFIKTKKVGGTSFEIALSSFCDDTSIITPISPDDEKTRADLGYPGAQNHQHQAWPDGSGTSAGFYNHIPAEEARKLIPQDIWDSYTKVTIWRDPFDAIISRYYWEKADAAGIPFGQFVQRFPGMLTENIQIAPLEGPSAPDVFLRYEHLEEDIAALGIDGLWERFSSLRAKGAFRPKSGTDPATLFARHPDAADIVAKKCAVEIRKFGYTRPGAPAAAAAIPEKPRANDFIFALSAGRTGTAWLAQLLGDNLEINSVHEPMGIEDFGTQMPEIRHMRMFNTYGMNESVRGFWKNKLDSLEAPYAESNHTLGKCGLIEALAGSSIRDRTTVIILRRDLAKQCASYVHRNDFFNITLRWQWYLDMGYRNWIVDPAKFMQLGQVGCAVWYALEMEARYAYYLLTYGQQIKFVAAKLEEAVTPAGATKLLAELGHKGRIFLPEKRNATRDKSGVIEELTAEIRTLLNRVNFDPIAAAAAYIKSGRRLDAQAMSRAAA
ncbi:sulfotransferase family protein [Leisingera sp. JC1]|uniref:sulfotransferase family protein n=1 Tax=Leisingera sp. JC1 TaxID=1855282 RepID=UPI0008029C2C|nr:sulfotransferase family protein [Leisingera sp. JC1]OBY27413.1 hypothetical protein A9D60_03450 [Leisingera sp. JC1]